MYVFFVSSDDESELLLGADQLPESARVICGLYDASVHEHDYTTYSSQQSSPVHLNAGSYYYIEARHKEGMHVIETWNECLC